MKEIYSAYFKMRELKLNYKVQQNKARNDGDKQIADEYGDKVTIVCQCMDILVKECKLKFEQ